MSSRLIFVILLTVLIASVKASTFDSTNTTQSLSEYLDTIPVLGNLKYINLIENSSDIKYLEGGLISKDEKSFFNIYEDKIQRIDLTNSKVITSISIPSKLLWNPKIYFSNESNVLFIVGKQFDGRELIYNFGFVNIGSGKVAQVFLLSPNSVIDVDVSSQKAEFVTLSDSNTIQHRSIFDGKVISSKLLDYSNQG